MLPIGPRGARLTIYISITTSELRMSTVSSNITIHISKRTYKIKPITATQAKKEENPKFIQPRKAISKPFIAHAFLSRLQYNLASRLIHSQRIRLSRHLRSSSSRGGRDGHRRGSTFRRRRPGRRHCACLWRPPIGWCGCRRRGVLAPNRQASDQSGLCPPVSPVPSRHRWRRDGRKSHRCIRRRFLLRQLSL